MCFQSLSCFKICPSFYFPLKSWISCVPVHCLMVYQVFVDSLTPLWSLHRWVVSFMKTPCGYVIFLDLPAVWSFLDCGFRRAEPSLFLAICLALRLLLLLTIIFGVDFYFFLCFNPNHVSLLKSEPAGFQDLPCLYIITVTTQLAWGLGRTEARTSQTCIVLTCGSVVSQ